ncbi:MAG TPA: PQQ-binding-like beta-propeller repeat protein [Candidatus Saccharimonadales bacterium]|nr:PQQ-binding-like beta-propeller repeat protein [Candidatus Saccharimonadales bacterium]
MRRLALIAALITGCVSPGAGSASPSITVTPSTAPSVVTTSGPTTSPSPTPKNDTDWPAYHRDPARLGQGATGSFSSVDVAWTSGALDGDVYAEPLVVRGLAIVATERNSVYALDERTGATVWHTTFGAPVDGNSLPCGNIKPVTGITGTPVADPAAGIVYVVAFEQPAHHELYALDIATGATRFHRTVDAPGADPAVHQERGALALANGRVYVPYGGLAGDCGSYRGSVVGASATAATGDLVSYRVPNSREVGIWAPSGIAVDANGKLFVATGNGQDTAAYAFSDAVIRLSADLQVEDWWGPTDWLALDRTDTDVGSVGPSILPGGLAVVGGKSGVVYVLRAADLGHLGAEISKAKVCGAVFGGFAFAAGVLYVPCTDGLAAVQIGSNGSITPLWRGPRSASGPPILVAGAVWLTDPATGTLYALDPANGQTRFQRQLGAMQHFTTPGAAGTEILVVAGGHAIALQTR